MPDKNCMRTDFPDKFKKIGRIKGTIMFKLQINSNDFRSTLIQAPMAGVSTPKLAAAVCNAGALGSLGIGNLKLEDAVSMIEETKALTDAPFNINFFCHEPSVTLDPQKDQHWRKVLNDRLFAGNPQLNKPLEAVYGSIKNDMRFAEAICDLHPKIVSFHFGIPNPNILDIFRKTGATLLASATNLTEADFIAKNGFDGIIAQGYEAGGHRGIFNPDDVDGQSSTHVLTNILVSTFNIPIIAAGGIMNGADIAALKKIGAYAVQLGTAFIGCAESAANDHYRQLLKSDAANNTTMTRVISGRPARALDSDFVHWGMNIDNSIIADYPYAYDAIKQVMAIKAKEHNFDIGGYWAGCGAPLARFMPAADLIAQLEQEYFAVIN
ncbi:nitronate monooxygenase [Bartonella sp. HY329]|uniref:NAD(P)H-dependent flavin oxidoreductase n=1 Tax=unclassified Bartonella TaxID=2645622 RepID=UPI0021C7A289|nr:MULTISPECIES: nitronate monooxygenase [unclassified Bartonella]UXM95139.1 nitronate monooxygenase [Bartonella sp. HY329]UXN09462.1 nitronate monooxygenase [Bartonella sp. HY328]